MFKKLILLSSTLFLGSCVYILKGTLHDLEIETPGAKNAECAVYVDGFKYIAHPPATINFNKPSTDVLVDCVAPGNRYASAIVQSGASPLGAMNVSNFGFPGFAWDYTSGALFQLDEKVIVDFRNIPTQPFPRAKYMDPALVQPDEYDLEEFRTQQLRMNRDKYTPVPELRRRQPQTFDQAPAVNDAENLQSFGSISVDQPPSSAGSLSAPEDSGNAVDFFPMK